jgi:hypothetical protein
MTDYRALCAELLNVIDSLPCETNYKGESRYVSPIDEDVIFRARAALAQPEQDDKTLKSIRATTPRYRMSVIVSTNDSAIDTRMNVIWQALDLSKEILESVSLPEQLPPLGSQ